MNKRNTRILIIVIFMMSGILGFVSSWYFHAKSAVPDRSSHVEIIETYHYPATFVKQLMGDPDAGKKIFKEYCSTCHAKEPMIDIRAPRIGDKAAWRPKGKLGVDVLLKITIQGVAAMPSRGGCFECSDEQLRETIQYILDQS
jgi:cytochrome c5